MGLLGRLLLTACAVLCATAAPAGAQSGAQTFIVNTTADGTDLTPGDLTCTTSSAANICTLRAAIQEADATSTADTIVLPALAGPYNLTIGTGLEPDVRFGDLDITNPLTIDGAGARSVIVDQNVADRVFEIQPSAGNITLEGLTVTGGGPSSGNGAGILNASTLTVVDSAVRGNEGASTTLGAGIATTGSLTVDRSLITNNQTPNTTGGGGIFNSSATVQVRNSTITGNTAANGSALLDQSTAPASVIEHSTIAFNTSTAGSSAALFRNTSGGSGQIRDSIVYGNGGAGTNCGASPGPSTNRFQTLGHNIELGTSCSFTNAGAGDKNTDPLLAPLAYSRAEDQTETFAPQPGSPAIDGGNPVGCPATDQRGLPRPSGSTCDVGAFEVQVVAPPPRVAPKPATLVLDPTTATRTPGDANTVTATVRNDDGTPAANQSVRYAITGANPGAGAVTTDASGIARISWDGVHEGTDTLSAFVDTNANLTSDAGEPTSLASVTWALPAPRQGRTANIEPVSGRVRITIRGARSSKLGAAGTATQLLTEARQVPLGTVIDVRSGRVQMTTVANKAGDVQKGDFYGGVFTSSQSTKSTRPITDIKLSESLICQSSKKRGKLTAARARKRHLWGNAHGRYRTRGRYSTATVRGTIWVQKDSCGTTTTAVRQGVVIVKDLVKRKNVRVKAGKSYTARRASRSRR